MYRDLCPSIELEWEYREGFASGWNDQDGGDISVDSPLIAEYGYYGLGYRDGVEFGRKVKNTSSEYYNQ